MTERSLRLEVGDVTLDGDLSLPNESRAVVLFAHGSGSSRHSSRNRRVAAALNDAGYATLLMDLLTAAEERDDAVTRQWRFDIRLLSERVAGAVDVLADETPGLPVATFGASTGAAAALNAAAARPAQVVAVVSRGGRVDLAESVEAVRAPSLFVVGERDEVVLELNRETATRLAAPHELAVVPGATHLFEEPGALDEVVRLTVAWLDRWVAEAT